MIKMGKHYQKILRRGAKSRSGGGVTQVTVGKLLSTAAMVDTGIVHIAVVNGCWLAITILPQQTLPLPRNGIMREMMGNCQNILRSAARKKVWWKCDKNHSWLSTIHNRTLGNGCPYCSGRNAIAGYNDFFTVRPDLAGQWDYDKNQKIRPDQLTVNAHDKVWWKCNKGHSWRAAVYSRANGSGCPYCAGKVAVKTCFIS